MLASQVSLHDIYSARQKIASIAERTPTIYARWSGALTKGSVHLKLENMQPTGSFKIRGAANKLLNLSPETRRRGVITVSSGNHGRAVSYVARQLGINAVVCFPETVPEGKREAIREMGAELIICGDTYDQATENAIRLQNERDLVMIHPFDDPYVIAGQGTIGLELIEDLPEMDTVIVPLSGGGLLAGIAFTLKSLHPSIHTVGVTMERGAAMVESLKVGRVVDIIEEQTLADELAGGIGPQNDYTFKMVQNYVDETVLVSESEIGEAMKFTLEKHHLVVEGGGAVGIAALLSNKVNNPGKNIAVVISGGNVDLQVLIDVLQEKYV